MTLTTHAVTSLVIAKYLPWPIAAFFVSAFVHYLMDVIPHGDEFLYWRYIKNKKDKLPLTVAIIDILLMLGLCAAFYFLDKTLPWYLVVSAAVGGILPDLLINLHTQARNRFRNVYIGFGGKLEHVYHRFLQAHYKWHMWWHYLTKKTIRFRYGVAMQIIFLGIVFWYYRFRG